MKLGFVGCGKMATALVQGVLKAGAFAKGDILAADRYPDAAKTLAEKCGVRVAADNRELASEADVLLLCVKPGDAAGAIDAVREHAEKKLLVSIMAGVTLAKLQKAAGPR